MFDRFSRDSCYIIAEIGGNFTAFEEARLLIDAAADCGVDAVKLQTYRAETLASRHAIFEMENTGIASQYDLFCEYQIGKELHETVFQYARYKGLDWFSTPSHVSDLDLLESLDVGAHKIGSDDAVNLPFLRQVAKTGKPIILSTGMCTLEEVRESVAVIQEESIAQLILLHAITSYPTHPEHVNLSAIHTLKEAFPALTIGYSDHTLSPVACLSAVAMGAGVVEKHFTCDKKTNGPDHMLSADPQEMKWLVDAIRTFEVMKGDGIKRPAACERLTRRNNRKSIILAKNTMSGERLHADSLIIKRPGYGIPPKDFEHVLGRVVSRDLVADHVLTWDDLA
jgi:N,N'-diacetyllegionaminate synthase